MTELRLPAEGGCRCGAVRFRLTAAPILTMACHCQGCQRMTASAYSLSAAIPAEGFEITRGDTVIGGAGEPPMHHICEQCGSWLFTKAPGLDWFVNVRPTMLDDAAWFSPFMETCTSEKLPWATTPAQHSFEGMPEPADFMRLTAEFAERGH